MSIRVLIVDDHAVVRAGLRHVLDAEPDIETVGEAGDAREAVFEARLRKPDVVLIDVVMPGKSGIEVTPEIVIAPRVQVARLRRQLALGDSRRIEVTPELLKESPASRVLVLSMQDDPSYVREAFAVGASGYVLKEAAGSELITAVREVARGGRYVHPELGARLIEAEAKARSDAELDPLSEREREVLRLLALGHTNQEIAKKLYISVRTAETHRAHIMQKLRLTTRAELVRYALERGLLDEVRRGEGESA